MHGWCDAACGWTGYVLVYQCEESISPVSYEFPADNSVLSVRHSFTRTDLPLVLEDEWWVPLENASRDVEVAWTAAEVDGSSWAAVDRGPHHIPRRELLGISEGLPDRFEWMWKNALEYECGERTVVRDFAEGG